MCPHIQAHETELAMEQEAGPGEPVRLQNQMAVMLGVRVAKQR